MNRAMLQPGRRAAALLLTLTLAVSAPLAAADPDVTVSKPEQVGLSAERLARIDAVINGYIEAGKVAGATGLIARRGEIAYFNTYGYRDLETKEPMPKDALFRIYSMSKAVTGVAVMILHEKYGFALRTPASRWIPALGDLEVTEWSVDAGTGDPRMDLVPANRDMTVQDLLTHTAGISYGGPRNARGGTYYAELGVGNRDQTLEEFVEKLGQAPLHNHPGTVWRYGYGMDVLGRLVEVISGKTFDVFLEDEIFAPLGMKDTAFYVRPGTEDRLAVLYTPDREAGDGTVMRSKAPPQDSYLTKPKIFYGGAGLVSTTTDYFKMVQMLLDGGRYEGGQLLSPKSVKLLSSDHIGDMPRVGQLLRPGDGFGLTFRVDMNPGINGALGSPGDYSWGGAAGTRFWIDPEEEMVGVFMIQILPHAGLTYGTEFRNLAYQAIVD